jgi:hypothetical protein
MLAFSSVEAVFVRSFWDTVGFVYVKRSLGLHTHTHVFMCCYLCAVCNVHDVRC